MNHMCYRFATTPKCGSNTEETFVHFKPIVNYGLKKLPFCQKVPGPNNCCAAAIIYVFTFY